MTKTIIIFMFFSFCFISFSTAKEKGKSTTKIKSSCIEPMVLEGTLNYSPTNDMIEDCKQKAERQNKTFLNVSFELGSNCAEGDEISYSVMCVLK